jgi:hypothetical protein
MVGRYGIDQLYYALLVLYLVLFVLEIMFKHAVILELLSLAVLIYTFFRVFSRNTYKRSNENQVFLSVWDNVKNFFCLNFSKIRDLPTKKYAKCPHCGAVLRLPRQRGRHTVRCPKCNNKFELKITFGKNGKNK